MAPKVTKLGPGTLKVGPTASVMDVSCQIQNAVVAWSADTEDDLKVLCGDTVPGARTYSSTISGTMLEDLDTGGFVDYTWTHKGETVDVEYVPNTDNGAMVVGQVVLDPLDVGSTDDFGTPMASDFEWTFVGDPVLTPGAGGAAAAASESVAESIKRSKASV